MSDFKIEDKSLESFMKEIDDLQRLFPKQARQVMQKVGNKARTVFVKKAKQLVKARPTRFGKTGNVVNYHKRIKRGKVWSDKDGIKVRIYNSAPHAHLIEYGHRLVTKEPDKKEIGFVKGYHVFDKAIRELEPKITSILEQEFDRIMSKL